MGDYFIKERLSEVLCPLKQRRKFPSVALTVHGAPLAPAPAGAAAGVFAALFVAHDLDGGEHGQGRDHRADREVYRVGRKEFEHYACTPFSTVRWFSSYLFLRKSMYRRKARARKATAVHTVKPPPVKSEPSW